MGEIVGIGAAGAWQRDASYYARAPWAGRRGLGGVPVVDGALTNPFAHATATALALDGDTGADGLREVGVELFRANPIEADDTSCLRLVTARDTTITVAVTLCATRLPDRDAQRDVPEHGDSELGPARLRAGPDGRGGAGFPCGHRWGDPPVAVGRLRRRESGPRAHQPRAGFVPECLLPWSGAAGR